MKPHLIISIGCILSMQTCCSIVIDLFPEPLRFFSSTMLEFRNYLYIGSENGRTVNHGNLGVEFPVAGFSPKENRRCLAGVDASVHLVMFPKNMKFAVDNFYATLAVYLNCFCSEKISCRLYPVYHVSGHLGDGTENDSALIHARAVSGETARFEMTFSPLKESAFSAGYGYYYHVCAQQGLTDRFDFALFLQPVSEKWLKPYIALKVEFVHLSIWRAGVDVEAGFRFVNSKARGIGLCFRYFNRMNAGYYFDKREKSGGVLIDFLL
jgi:hypothetical protein